MAQQYQVSILYFLFLTSRSNCQIGYVVNGGKANIKDFSYSVSLIMRTPTEEGNRLRYSGCGSSIINQNILLTAAHCVSDCNTASNVTASVGSETHRNGTKIPLTMIYIHGNYDKYDLVYDIALLKTETPIKFSNSVGRVAIMKDPPYYEKALIAGWGLVDEINEIRTHFLHFTDQFVWDRRTCQEQALMTYPGVFCAQAGKHSKYSSRGDSGSALVVRGYIQIGIVSYKYIAVDRSVVMYTDIGLFYDWIIDSIPELYCLNDSIDDEIKSI